MMTEFYYTPSSYLAESKVEEEEDDVMSMSSSLEEVEKAESDQLEERLLQQQAHQTDRLREVHRNLGTLKRKQAYRSILNGETIPKPLTSFGETGLKLISIVADGVYSPSEQGRIRTRAARQRRIQGGMHDNKDNIEEEDHLRTLRARRLRKSLREINEEMTFLEERERTRKETLEQERLARQKEQAELLSIEQERQTLERQKAAFEAKRQQTLREMEQQRNVRYSHHHHRDDASVPSLDGTETVLTTISTDLLFHLEDLARLMQSIDVTSVCTDLVCMHGTITTRSKDKMQVWEEEEEKCELFDEAIR
jgi:hypothetical protein